MPKSSESNCSDPPPRSPRTAALRNAPDRTLSISKLGVVVEEADETVFWFEVLTEAEIIPAQRVQALCDEAKQLLAIFAASQKTVRQRYGKH